MAAGPAPEPDLDTLARHVLPAKIDAVAYGLSVMHRDVLEIRRVQADHGLQLGDLAEGQRSAAAALDAQGEQMRALAETQGGQGETLNAHGEMLSALQKSVAEILRRLPAEPDGQ